MGNFIIGGMLRKEGRVFKRLRTRWIEIRSVGIYYYKIRGDRNAKGSMPLQGCQVKATSKYREHFHIAISNSSRTMHIWANSEEEKLEWVNVLTNVIFSLE